ncbi:neuronal growth regulator 1-like [Gigantopelta aegis]|uniref:neuronal growth regulator 1-like n=1 Tax=Gigantopelta aegis TaxID=1735272 RepID=UPI001B88D649|nr:neuronal growth regulator 1-like [Gigantopelta aegis]
MRPALYVGLYLLFVLSFKSEGASIISLTLNKQPTNLTVNEGVNVTLRCEVDGYPLPGIKLLTNSKVLNEEKYSTVAEYTLTAAGCLDTGQYTCNANNSISSCDKTVVLDVICSPRLDGRVQFIKTYSAAVNSTVTMEMSVIANPKVRSFKWYKLTDGKHKIFQARSSVHAASDVSYEGKLTLIGIQKEDFGIYQVVVSNSVTRDLVENITLTQERGGITQDTPTDKNQETETEDSHVTTIVAVVIGVVILLSLFIGGAIVYYKKKREKNEALITLDERHPGKQTQTHHCSVFDDETVLNGVYKQ